MLVAKGWINTPPPIVSRIYQELSNGMNGYMDAYSLAVVVIPQPLRDIARFLLVIQIAISPILIEKFTDAMFLTPIFAFLSTIGYCAIYNISVALENPYGDDFVDVPLLEMALSMNEVLQAAMLEVNRTPDTCPVKGLF